MGISKPKSTKHPYLSGNFAPVKDEVDFIPCKFSGSIPIELADGEYVRNGGNPEVVDDDNDNNDNFDGDFHWFDGHGMLFGVYFQQSSSSGGRSTIQPKFVSRRILTDVYLASKAMPSSLGLRAPTPILPSLATFIRPVSFSSILDILASYVRCLVLIIISHLGLLGVAVRKISVANTSIIYHNGRALATCQSGPPMRILLPGLETVGWFSGDHAEGERIESVGVDGSHQCFGGSGLSGFLKSWTTGHPHVDPQTGELVSFQSSFMAPFVWYTMLPGSSSSSKKPAHRLCNLPIPGISTPKMMHDFGVSSSHVVILDLPLSMNPANLLHGKPMVFYDTSTPSRFGVFPRNAPSQVRWFETGPCCIFHIANTWDEVSVSPSGTCTTSAVHMLACRLNSPSILYDAGAVANPYIDTVSRHQEQCWLYYYRFDLSDPLGRNLISHQWALTSIPFEFPVVRSDRTMSEARFIYGCSTTRSIFCSSESRRSFKIDCIVKVDALALIRQGYRNNKNNVPVPVTGTGTGSGSGSGGCVDPRSIQQVLREANPDDPIQIFQTPPGWFAQEVQFVPRQSSAGSNEAYEEDDGFLLTYVFDESQLDADGNPTPHARSELWIIDARNMKEVVARVYLPQRVPYGLHGQWFPKEEIEGQREVESLRRERERLR